MPYKDKAKRTAYMKKYRQRKRIQRLKDQLEILEASISNRPRIEVNKII